MVSDVSISSALSSAANTEASTTQLADDFSQFLTLLTIQLQNQDPLSPMETNEFTNQLVAFTGVEQQINMNQKLDNLVALGIGTAYSEAQSYIGQDVSYVSSEFSFTGAPSEIRYSLGSAAVESTISIYDESGSLVFSEAASKNAGATTFTWDGTTNSGGLAPAGTYEVRIDALDATGEGITTSTVVNGLVRGTESQNGQIFLLVGERAVALSNVLNTTETTATTSNNNAMTMALSYVGLNVTYSNSELYYDGNNDVSVDYTLDSEADRAKVLIFDDLGNQIYSADIPTDEGTNSFTWDGITSDNQEVSAGSYFFVIDAIDANDQRIANSSTTSGTVTGIETRDGQIYLNVGTNSVSIANVLSANVPEDTGGTS